MDKPQRLIPALPANNVTWSAVAGGFEGAVLAMVVISVEDRGTLGRIGMQFARFSVLHFGLPSCQQDGTVS